MEYIIFGVLAIFAVVGFALALTILLATDPPKPQHLKVRWKCDHCYASCRHVYDKERPVSFFDEVCLTHSILAPDCENLYGATRIRLYTHKKGER